MKTINEFLDTLDTELDLSYEYSDGITFDEFCENVERQINETEVIYYSVAMEYLSKNDPSLNESMSIANEFGFETENLNSETLATLLNQQNLRQEFYDLQDEIEEYFDEYDEYITENA